jgi:hypothetical protein
MACSPTIESRLSTSETFGAWKTVTDTTLNTIQSTDKPTPMQQSELVQAEDDIFKTFACLQQKQGSLSNVSNDIQKAQEQILALQSSIEAEQNNVDIAKDRVAYIRNPEEHTSFYESWFPMDRPMRARSVPYFIGITVFFVVAGVLLIVTFSNRMLTVGPLASLYIRTRGWLGPSLGAALLVIIGVVWYFTAK